MTTIEFVTIEVGDVAEAEAFYAAAFDVGDRVRVEGAQDPSSGFRGFTLSLVVSQPATVRNLINSAAATGATVLKPAAKSLWGYGGIVRAPDGTIWTVASPSKKDTGPATRKVDEFVLQLGVADVTASKQFYADRGFSVGKSYGRRYVELDTGAVALTLSNRAALAKTTGIPADGNGSHRLLICGAAGDFADPDGFIWKAPSH